MEIYAQNIPTLRQNAYLHMVIEERILNLAGEKFRNDIIALKLNGYKAEPAFGKLLNLQNPFEELLELSECSDKTLTELLIQSGNK